MKDIFPFFFRSCKFPLISEKSNFIFFFLIRKTFILRESWDLEIGWRGGGGIFLSSIRDKPNISMLDPVVGDPYYGADELQYGGRVVQYFGTLQE